MCTTQKGGRYDHLRSQSQPSKKFSSKSYVAGSMYRTFILCDTSMYPQKSLFMWFINHLWAKEHM